MKEREIEFVRYGRVQRRKQIFIGGKWIFKPTKAKMALLEEEEGAPVREKKSGLFDWLWGDAEEDNK